MILFEFLTNDSKNQQLDQDALGKPDEPAAEDGDWRDRNRRPWLSGVCQIYRKG